MKLIIDIPEEMYEFTKSARKARTYNAEDYVDLILNGTPLDDVKAEIADEYANTHHMYPEYASGLSYAYEIIDKYMDKTDMKTNRKNCEYRHENGNCLKVGGFCTSVDDEHCMRSKSCNTCKNNDDEFSGECYECIKGIFDHYEPEDATDE